MTKTIKYSFDTYINSLIKCYAKDVEESLPKADEFPKSFIEAFDEKQFDKILEYGQNHSDQFVKSMCYRIVGVHNIQIARRNNAELDINKTFELIANSITEIPSISTISSVGSQGFLSIPIFKFEEDIENFEFIRFHIWSPKLDKYIDPKTSEMFSIHSHRFHAKSWIITGELLNQDYTIDRESSNPNSALFEIKYNATLNEVNQHQSIAKNTGRQIEVIESTNSIFTKHDTYEINQGDFHKSTQKNTESTTATFFSFYLTNEKLGESEVTGPLEIEESKINRKMYIEPNDYINDIKESINAGL